MKRLIFALLLAALSASGGASQDKTSRPLVVLVGHTVTMSWTYTNPALYDVDHYNLYSSSISGGPYTIVGTSTTMQYADLTTIAGHTYYYVVTAVAGPRTDCSFLVVPTPCPPTQQCYCGESAYSPQSVPVTIPTP
ncbi:Uncharacterised protein [uncultured archaeon]|nr:Uncharacterised protein [uncultured archaeon]